MSWPAANLNIFVDDLTLVITLYVLVLQDWLSFDAKSLNLHTLMKLRSPNYDSFDCMLQQYEWPFILSLESWDDVSAIGSRRRRQSHDARSTVLSKSW